MLRPSFEWHSSCVGVTGRWPQGVVAPVIPWRESPIGFYFCVFQPIHRRACLAKRQMSNPAQVTKALSELVRSFPGAHVNWTYEPSRPRLGIIARRCLARLKRRGPADHLCLKSPHGQGRWLIYFMYLPQGQMSDQHRFTLDRLAPEEARTMIVCACPPAHPILKELERDCDALLWKSTEGFDFSGYAVGLTELAQQAPGSDVLVFNDSMLGPFTPLTPFIAHAPWRLTGLSATALEENHLQSFAFVIKNLTLGVMRALAPVLSTKWRYDTSDPVILLQETLLARIANRHMSVGAYWYTDGSRYLDLSLNCPELLIDSGFPLLKRSLFTKFSQVFQNPGDMRTLLDRLGHPPMNTDGGSR